MTCLASYAQATLTLQTRARGMNDRKHVREQKAAGSLPGQGRHAAGQAAPPGLFMFTFVCVYICIYFVYMCVCRCAC